MIDAQTSFEDSGLSGRRLHYRRRYVSRIEKRALEKLEEAIGERG